MKSSRPIRFARLLVAVPTALACAAVVSAQEKPAAPAVPAAKAPAATAPAAKAPAAEAPVAEAPADAPAAPAAGLPTDPVGYFIGMSIGQQLSGQGFQPNDFTTAGLSAGIADALAKKDPALTPEQMQAVVQKIQGMLNERQGAMMAERNREVAANLEKSTLFLEENGKKEGIKTLASGLQYKVLTAGTGKSPTAEDVVQVHYTGTLIDGTKFDSSVDRGEPAEFSCGQVIPGWRQALQEMKEGDKWMLYIPPQLAYGERGAPGGAIGPNEALIFEVELIKIVR
jgi:FKBP-type peptidyl-prolyl cis-trans isomerase FklB